MLVGIMRDWWIIYANVTFPHGKRKHSNMHLNHPLKRSNLTRALFQALGKLFQRVALSEYSLGIRATEHWIIKLTTSCKAEPRGRSERYKEGNGNRAEMRNTLTLSRDWPSPRHTPWLRESYTLL